MNILIKIWNSKLIKVILLIFIILFMWLWITKPSKNVYPNKQKIELLKKQISNRDKILKSSIKIYDSLKLENNILNEKLKNIKTKIIYIKEKKKKEIKKINNQSLEEDLVMFNDFTRDTATISIIDSKTIVLIKPSQLKEINIIIVKYKTQEEEITILENKIEILSKQKLNLKSEIKQLKKDNKIYNLQTIDLKRINDELKQTTRELKKIKRKSNIRTGVVSGSVGIIIGLVLGLFLLSQ